ncbi:MAG: helix-turn-helix domain-containing protein [Opitutaceae bacterium]|jgi:transcriptional regulator with XRE-family HTH domain|nr:helix-turn-helix domain-containing protein [Opitutaceae bacterium]
MDCSSRIRLERQKRSWTQEQLAERARLSVRTVQRIETGAEASAETLRLIADALGVPPDSLRHPHARIQFGAPWSRLVKITTPSAVLLLAAAAALTQHHAAKVAALAWLPPLFVGIVVFSALFSVGGYSIHQGQLLVHRMGWSTRFDLARLTAFEANPHAMTGSIRLCGNGGLFCFIGWYRNPVLGNYRAYVTDTARAVVLEFGPAKKIVVSPDDPEAFVASLRAATRGIQASDATPSGPSAA